MTVYFITRHNDAVDWLHRHGVKVDVCIEHLESVDVLQPGDRVYGILPIHIIAEICARGVRYWHLVLPQKREQRGEAHSADAMDEAGATFVEYVVRAVAGDEVVR